MTINELKQLARYAAAGKAPETFSVENVDEALVDGLRELCGSVNQFMKNRYDIYEIIIEAADEIVPNKVIDAVGIFAEVKQVGQGQKAMFRTKLGRARARKFLTQVGLSGVYESFRLDNGTFEVAAHAVGGACTIDFERMLDGAENMAELVQLLTEAQTDAVYQEVQRALRAAVSQTGVPANNRANVTVGNDFDGQEMMKLISTVRAYGSGAVIFAPPDSISVVVVVRKTTSLETLALCFFFAPQPVRIARPRITAKSFTEKRFIAHFSNRKIFQLYRRSKKKDRH